MNGIPSVEESPVVAGGNGVYGMAGWAMDEDQCRQCAHHKSVTMRLYPEAGRARRARGWQTFGRRRRRRIHEPASVIDFLIAPHQRVDLANAQTDPLRCTPGFPTHLGDQHHLGSVKFSHGALSEIEYRESLGLTT
ncbi:MULTISPECIES: hypothetical protein [Burkholderia]|uniref:hypothetical protein n=1 Tax=Burkholderia TaxID=32008 RepID=UPI001B774E17|nr:hypothetical protein [Burkholderia ambifaria]